HARAGDDEVAAVDRNLDLVRVDAGQRHQDQHLAAGFEDVDRRLPGRTPRGRAHRPEKLAMQPVGTCEHLAGLGPHPIAGEISFQLTPLGSFRSERWEFSLWFATAADAP